MSVYRGAGGSGDATNDATVTAVQAAATSAATSATNAANSATAAANSATGAATSATNASNSATTAAGQATTAAGHATNASTFATNSSLSADDSADSATEAEGYASEAFDYKVEASSSASSAATSATNAGTSATNSAASAASALAIYGNTTAMNNAVASATASASAASTSASNASTSATTATNAASTATTQATNAAASALAADADATSASIDANEAQAAATAAQAAVSNATAIYGSIADIQQAEANSEANRNAAAASAGAASTSATTATTQAGIATTQASAASASAAAASAVALGNEPVRHSVRPSLLLDFANTKTLDPRITFTRASTGTFYDGKTVAKAEENLLIYSQEFDNASWSQVRLTITANATTAPDGTTTAEQINQVTGQTTSGLTAQTLSINANSTYSVYAKANTKSFICIQTNSALTNRTWFNLSTGAVATTNASHTATIVSAGNGWYRCIVTSSAVGTAFGIFNADSDNSLTVTDSGGIFIWGAQVEQRSSVTAYTATTTAPITNYIPALQTAASGVARFEHNPVTGESLGLEIEEQRTNLFTRSGDWNNAAWAKTNATTVGSSGIAPDGTQTAALLVEDTATNFHQALQAVSVSAGDATFSFYAKANSRNWVIAWLGTAGAFFNLSDGTLGTVSAGVTATVTSAGNGWYRCAVTRTVSAGSISCIAYLATGGSGSASYAGNGWGSIYIWGAQVEAGAFATSYIPTVASQVTRSADSASMTGTNFSSWFKTDEGTVYTEAIAPNTITSVGTVELSNSASAGTNYLTLHRQAGTWRYRTSIANLNLSPPLTEGIFNKAAFSYSATSYPISVNGTTVQTNTTTGFISGVNQLLIGFATITASPLNGTIKKLAYYPKRLTNAELQGLTTV